MFPGSVLCSAKLVVSHLGYTPLMLLVTSPFFPTIVLFENRPFPWVSGGFLERRIPGKNGEGSTRRITKLNPLNGGLISGSCTIGFDPRIPTFQRGVKETSL